MPIRLREWIQREWHNAGRDTFRASGDLNDLSSLLTSPHHVELKRAPAWEAHLDFPSGFDEAEAAFYDRTNQRVIFAGLNASNQLAAVYADVTTDPWTMSGIVTLIASAISVAGLERMNWTIWGGDLYVVCSDGFVYRGAYGTTVSVFYNTAANAIALCPFGDRMYLALSTGAIMRLNAADNAFEAYFDPIANLTIVWMTAFRGYILVVTRRPTGELVLHRLQADASNPHLDTLAIIPAARGDAQLSGLVAQTLFALHDDALFLSPGRDKLLDGGNGMILYRFNGTAVDLWSTHTFTAESLTHFGLLTWRDQLVLYELTATAHLFYTLVGHGWSTGIPALAAAAAPAIQTCWVAAGELVMATDDGTDEGIKYLSHDTLSDGYLLTPYLDMQTPAKKKRLEQITVLMDSKAASSNIVIKYRTDDTAGWTTAATEVNTLRAVASGIAVEYYQLQLRIELDDNSGANTDYRIEAVSVLYSVDI